MNKQQNILENLQCPACQTSLTVEEKTIICQNQHEFPQKDSQPLNLTYPEELTGNDATFFQQYMEIADQYDSFIEVLFGMHGSDHNRMRRELVEALKLQPGDRVLDVSTGTGINIPFILGQISEEGHLVVQDLSPSMLKVARTKFGHLPNVEFVQSNASYLPFEDDYFDAVSHSGGINTFTKKKRAIDEMHRVVKVGGRVLLSDEGMGPWNLGTDYGRRLLEVNGLYKDQPPLELLPVAVENVTLNWIMSNVFYVLHWTKRAKEPVINLPQEP